MKKPTSMRKFFFEQLNELESNTGLKYRDRLIAEDGENAINSWLDKIEKIRNKFIFIDDHVIAQIVESKILEDDQLRGLYPNKIHQWLSAYWSTCDAAKRQAMIQKFNNNENEVDADEVAPPEVAQKYIEQFKKNLRTLNQNVRKL